MECTQRLECTQELYATQTKRISPEQIGFLGICGTKYPVKMGLNKIGRDPSTCNIVLNLNSISRQHALINILNDKEFMLMDLDSSNKTKVLNKTLRPYAPHPIKNGDTVQFGDVFGIFRLLEEDTDLPMTQAIDIPDTPVFTRHASRLGNAVVTMIPESPDVSDKDDSFIVPSQPKGNQQFKSPSNKYIKQSTKIISIQPIGSNKIDNVYWNASKKSSSLTLDDSNISLNDSAISVKSNSNIGNINQNNDDDIHEMETQPPFPANNESTDSIYTAATQMPDELRESPSIHSLDTQFPEPTEFIPVVCKINNQTDIQFNLFSANKENDNSIFNAETQLFVKGCNVLSKSINKDSDNMNIFNADTQMPTVEKQRNMLNESINKDSYNMNLFNADTQMPTVENHDIIDVKDKDDANSIFNAETLPPTFPNKVNKSFETTIKSEDKSITKLNTSDEEILLDEVDGQDFEDAFDSQPLLPPSPPKNVDINSKETVKIEPSPLKRMIRIKSSSSTDCEDIDDIDIIPSQKKTQKNDNEDDVTDCEDDLFEDEPEITKPIKLPIGSPKVRLKDISIQKTKEDTNVTEVEKPNDLPTDRSKVNFEDMKTQVIEVDTIPRNDVICNSFKEPVFEDMPTQIIPEDNIKNETNFEDLATQVIDEAVPFLTNCNTEEDKQQYSEEIISPFKIPFKTPLKIKKRDMPKPIELKPVNLGAAETKISVSNEEDDDKYYAATQDLFDDLCSQRETSPEVVELAQIKTPSHKLDQKEISSKQKYVVADKSSGSSDGDEKVNNFVSSLSKSQIRDVVGVQEQVEKLKIQHSDPSDVDSTPKKMRMLNLLHTDLPNSQEIKCSVSLTSKSLVTESSSESEPEEDSQEGTPILFRRKKRPKAEVKMDLTKKFDSKALPTRIITRVRKPTFKIQEGDEESKKNSKSILKPTFLTEQDDDVDKEIITENISRLKSKIGKKNNKSPKNDSSIPGNIKENIVRPKHKMNVIKAIAPDNIETEVKKETITIKNKKDKASDKINHKSRRTRRNQSNKDKDANIAAMNETTTSQTAEAILSTSNRRDNSSLNSTAETNISTRSTRSSRNTRNKSKNESKSEKTSVSPEKDTATKRRGRPKRTQKTEEKNESSPEREKEIRRSKRQRPVKTVTKVTGNSKINKPLDDISTVYSISSESDVNSPRSLKRCAVDDAEGPSSKRTRSVVTSNSSNSSLRSTPARALKTQHVLFTAFPCEEVKNKLEKLGAVVVDDVPSCTVVLTLQIKRTFKLLCAVGLGRPVVGPSWVQACVDNNALVDPWLYILKDSATEARFNFSLQRTLTGRRDFLKGYNVSCTPSVQPRAPEMKMIVECSGGTWRAARPNWLCVSCGADRALWAGLARRGAALVSSELVLSGVLRQALDVAANQLL